MKKAEIRRTSEIKAVPFNGSAEFKLKPLAAPGELQGLAANVVVVEPGGQAYSWHWHETNEELFFVLSGNGIVRTVEGERTVGPGDAIVFPAGPEGAHVMRNASETEALTYLDVGTAHAAEIVHFPEIGKILAIAPRFAGMRNEAE